jgi:hypothetical protein
MHEERTIGTYAGPATLVRAHARVGISCSYAEYQDFTRAGSEWVAGLTSWHGRFEVDGPAHVDPGVATLVLPDGRAADILVTHVREGQASGEFTGAGAPPR